MKKLLLYISSVCLAGVFFMSCAKKGPDTTPTTILTGHWQVVQTATDDNANRKLDPEEIHNLDPGVTDYYLFNANYTGIEEVTYSGTPTDYSFVWGLPNGSQFLQIFLEGHDSTTYHIVTFSPANTTLLDTSQAIYSWKIMKKRT